MGFTKALANVSKWTFFPTGPLHAIYTLSMNFDAAYSECGDASTVAGQKFSKGDSCYPDYINTIQQTCLCKCVLSQYAVHILSFV